MTKKYEMGFHWDDQEEAYYRGTNTHRQDGYLKVWKLSHETDEAFNERAELLFFNKVRFMVDNSGYGGYGIDYSTFPKFLKKKDE